MIQHYAILFIPSLLMLWLWVMDKSASDKEIEHLKSQCFLKDREIDDLKKRQRTLKPIDPFAPLP
jgi:hypothetical protein